MFLGHTLYEESNTKQGSVKDSHMHSRYRVRNSIVRYKYVCTDLCLSSRSFILQKTLNDFVGLDVGQRISETFLR